MTKESQETVPGRPEQAAEEDGTGPATLLGSPEPFDLLAVAGGSAIRKVLPLASVFVVLAVVVARRRARRLKDLATKVLP